MDVFKVVITLALFVILIVSIIKKYNILTVLTGLSVVGYLCATAINGTSVIGENSIGNIWLDNFEAWRVSLTSTVTGSGILIMTVMAYSVFMDKIKASNMFAGLLAIPLTKVKSSFALICLAPVLGFLVLIIIPSGMSCYCVCLATIYPVLVAAGCHPLTAAVALLLGCGCFAGPANPFVSMGIGLLGINLDAATFFVQYGFLTAVVIELVCGIVLALWSKALRRKGDDGCGTADIMELDIKTLGVPKWYGLLPLIPLVFIFVFSKMGPGGVVMSVVAAYFLSLIISGICHFFVVGKGNRKNMLNEIGPTFYHGMGDAFGRVVAIVAMGTLFGSVLNNLGGIKVIMNSLVGGLGLGFWPMLVVIFVLYIVMMGLAGATLAIPVLIPAIVEVANATGNAALLPIVVLILVFGAGLGTRLQPFSATALYCAEIHNVDVMVYMRFAVVPAMAGAVATFVWAVLFYALPMM